jgi:hypothetical protein
LTVPEVCTPGNPGIGQVTACSLGVTSPPVTIYVHAPITSIAISKVPGQPQTLRTDCISKGPVHGPEKWLFQAAAFNGNTDITQSVGPFSWHTINPGTGNIVTLSSLPNGTQGCLLSPQGQCLNQEIATATTPGVGQIYASAGPFVGQPISVETCHVNSISIAAAPGNDPSITSFLVNSGTSTTMDATVTDIANQPVTGVPLTWSTSNPVSVGASGVTSTVYGSRGTANASGAGQGTVIASCTPPACNAGIKPTLPIYPQAAFNFDVRSTSSTATSPTVYATTTACNTTAATCTPTLISITRPSATAPFAAATPIGLLSTPNSLLFDRVPTSPRAYLGVDSNDFNQKGLMIFDGSSVTQVRSAPGKVLAISPDGNSTIVSDTVDSPNLLFICTNCSSTSRTVTTFQISGATAAAFSPDNLKAYILAGNNLYVYSKLDPLQTINLGGAGTDVAFHPEGGFAYVAGPSTSLTPYRNCDNAPISSATLNTSNTPLLIRPLPDGSSLLVLDPPDIDVVSVTSLTALGCSGTVTDTTNSFDLGEGSFIPTQFFVSPDGATAYILGNSSAGPPPSRLPFVMVFNVNTQSASALSLSNSATPLSASLSPDGKLLFVGADDGSLHVIDTTSGLDTQQVTFPFPTNELCFGPGNPPTQVPLSQVTVSAVAQSGPSWAYTYSVISGALKVGQNITIANLSVGGDNGTYTITGFGTDSNGNPTFLVTNANGAPASNQSGLGTVPIACNPDLVAVKP